MSTKIHIGEVGIALEEYAIVANAILGIRNSGKTFLAKSIAEQMLEAEVPIVAFDPIGVWRHLRRPAGKRGKGFKIVIAGGEEPDLPLTPQSAPEIVRAAIRENVPLIIDLYDSKLSKGDWRKIVRASFRTLMYENRGVRHIFLEEAAEFVPQSVGRGEGDGETYAEVEKVVRMGGNKSLGITLINQRAQEVNKAVLDLSENLMLMRQRGQKAIEQLAKWIDHLDPDSAKSIAAGMAKMATGDVWVFDGKADTPVLTRAPALRSFHPDRRRPELLAAAGKPADTGDFVSRMSGELAELIEKSKTEDPGFLRKRVAELERENARLARARAAPATSTSTAELQRVERQHLATLKSYEKGLQISNDNLTKLTEYTRVLEQRIEDCANVLEGTAAMLTESAKRCRLWRPTVPRRPRLAAIPPPTTPATGSSDVDSNAATLERPRPAVTAPPASTSDVSGPLGKAQRLLDALAWWEAVGFERAGNPGVAAMAGQSHTSSAYERRRSELVKAGLVTLVDGQLKLTDAGRARAQLQVSTTSAELLQEAVLRLLEEPLRRMLDALLSAYPDSLSNQDVAAAAGQSHTSSSYERRRSRLVKLDLVSLRDGQLRAQPFLFLEKA